MASYAKTGNGRSVFRFGNKQLRDFVIENWDERDLLPASRNDWDKAVRNDPTVPGYSPNAKGPEMSAYDMDIYEYWDGELGPLLRQADELGLL